MPDSKLREMTALEQLIASTTQITRSGVGKLYESLPNCRICGRRKNTADRRPLRSGAKRGPQEAGRRSIAAKAAVEAASGKDVALHRFLQFRELWRVVEVEPAVEREQLEDVPMRPVTA